MTVLFTAEGRLLVEHVVEGKSRSQELPVTRQQWERFEKGWPIQLAMPHLSPDQREYVLSGWLPEDDSRNGFSLRVLPQGSNGNGKGYHPGTRFFPFWDEHPRFLRRTATKFSRIPLSEFEGRGGSSEMLDSILDGLEGVEGVVLAGGFVQQLVQDCLLQSVVERVDAYDGKLGEVAKKPRGHALAKDVDLFFLHERGFRETLDRLRELEGEGCNVGQDRWFWSALEEVKLSTDHDEAINGARFVQFRRPRDANDERLPGAMPDVQLVKLVWYEDAEHVVDSFDLTCVQFAVDVDTRELVFNPAAVFDLAKRRLVLHRMQFPASTLRRIVKYSAKGFYACPGALARIAQELASAVNQGAESGEDFVYVD